LSDSPTPRYEELVKRFSLKSPTEGTNMLLTAKRIFERYMFEVVGEYEQKDQATKQEIAELKESLGRLINRS
jgi:hypothetical protein